MSIRTTAPEQQATRAPLARTVWRAWCADLVMTGLALFPLTVSGRVRRAAELRHRRVDTTATPTSPRFRGNVPLATLATVLPSLVAFVSALLVVYLVWAGWLYPLRPDVIEHLAHPFRSALPGAWGGPTLIGAWFVHATSAIGMQVLAMAVIRAMAALHARLT